MELLEMLNELSYSKYVAIDISIDSHMNRLYLTVRNVPMNKMTRKVYSIDDLRSLSDEYVMFLLKDDIIKMELEVR